MKVSQRARVIVMVVALAAPGVSLAESAWHEIGSKRVAVPTLDHVKGNPSSEAIRAEGARQARDPNSRFDGVPVMRTSDGQSKSRAQVIEELRAQSPKELKEIYQF